jgi:hypothetical protein
LAAPVLALDGGPRRRWQPYFVTELLESGEAAVEADLRELVMTCIVPSMSGGSNIDIQIRNGVLTAIHRT